MTDRLIYAQLSGRVYFRTPENRMATPDGWAEQKWLQDDSVTGFSAEVYRNGNGNGNEIVIAFAGTNETMWKDFAVGNIPAGAGLSSAQITQAMTFTRVRKIRAAANGAWRVSV